MATAPTGDDIYRGSADKPSLVEDNPFVEQPSDDFFCPVTYSLLLKPHLTLCCGKHLSQEAAARIQSKGGACPMCNTPHLSTVLNKHFQRQVNELGVICRHEDQGCGWQGKLSDLERHIQFCPVRDQPLMTDQLKITLYGRDEAKLTGNIRRKQVSGPGLQSATVNHSTHVIIELTDSSDKTAVLPQNITAQLETVLKEASPTTTSWRSWFTKPQHSIALNVCKTSLSVAMITPSQYKVTYTAVSRGQHKLHVQINDREISGSPFIITVYPDPTQLGLPVRTVPGLSAPYGIAINSCGEAVISEYISHRVSIFDIIGQKIDTFGSHGDRSCQMVYPAGIAIDEMDNIYISSDHKLQRFTSSGELIKCVGQKGRKEGEFDNPRGVTLYNNQVYVCDFNNHRIQVFDPELNFVQSIGSRGTGRVEFYQPHDIKFDTAGSMYVAEWGKKRVQVLGMDGCFNFGQEEEGNLGRPSGLHIADKFVYVSDYSHRYIVIYETSGQFVTKFGGSGREEGQLNRPRCITSCSNGFIHVCDYGNNRVQIF